jgi:prepilin-type N-terminal cleavage/methylation domain-containing protein/prepilin-type processing-associated H-X9-DG protein
LSSFWKNKAEGKHGGQEQRAKGRNGKMTGLNRKGFTLVELLVVVVIIAMLVGLTVPAVQNARERARQAQCTNNQHEIALAVLQYETAKKSFPGYVNKFGTTRTSKTDSRPPLSWATVILPGLGNEKAWQEWRQKTRTSSFTDVAVNVPQYICPSNSLAKGTDLSYAANCGREDSRPQDSSDKDNWDGTAWDLAANGVFQNRYASDQPAVTSSSLRDGAQHTIMISENLQGGDWFARPDASTIDKLAQNEFGLGIIWHPVNYPSEQEPSDKCTLINGCRDDSAATSYTARFARPSSNHPGGVIMTFCDGHQQFVSERIQYLTFHHLMTPDSNHIGKVGVSGTNALPAQPDDPELRVGQ